MNRLNTSLSMPGLYQNSHGNFDTKDRKYFIPNIISNFSKNMLYLPGCIILCFSEFLHPKIFIVLSLDNTHILLVI